jgi:membrane-associated phospholipid phosphatase
MVLICSVCIITSNHTIAQSISQPDSSLIRQHTTTYQPKPVTVKSFIVPAVLITTGSLASSGKIIISNQEIKEERDEHFQDFHTSIDNYLQFAPIAAGYAMLIDNPEHSFRNYTEKVVLTEVMLNAIIQPVKHITKVPRPDTGAPNSFPSGHTTQAFAGATVFSDEFAQHNLALEAAAYSSAAAVGVMRVLNNRHWAGDVVAGAGFGILSAKLSELIIDTHDKKRHPSYNKQL